MQKPQKDPNTTNQINPFELPEDRLASTTKTGERIYFYPAEVKGKFRQLRSVFYWILIIVFMTLPWIKVGGHQWVMLDIIQRRFSIFGVQFWGHDAPLLFLVLVSFVVFMALITAILGRVWCGWACPQTVFIDRIYRKIEEVIEGPASVRRKTNALPLTPKATLKKGLKWTLFTLISLMITHSFLAYFVGVDQVLLMIQHSPKEHPTSFLTIFITTAIILFDFGWFREQFCIIACPYGRFQSVVMDENSLVVGYDTHRGEPRKKSHTDLTSTGDCINCYRCVQVCPTGVDIRRGVQLECIMCTACIDACDTVMTKLNKPKGLIRYSTEKQLAHPKSDHSASTNRANGIFRNNPRIWVYTLILTLSVTALIYFVSHRDRAPIHLSRSKETPYTLSASHSINAFTARIHNQYFEPISVTFSLLPRSRSASEDGVVEPFENRADGVVRDSPEIVIPTTPLTIMPNQTMITPIIFKVDQAHLKHGKYTAVLTYTIRLSTKTLSKEKEVILIGPM